MSYRFIDTRVNPKTPSTHVIQGFNRNVNGTWRQAAECGSANEFFDLPVTEVDCDISSNSTTANQLVMIVGCNQNGDELKENAILNGRTRVQLTNQYFRIKAIIVLLNTQSSQPFMDNDEDCCYVYDRSKIVTLGKPSTYFGIIDLGKSISKQGCYYLAPGKRLAFVSMIVVSDSSLTKILELTVQYKKTNSPVWYTIAEAYFGAGNSSFPLDCTPSLYDEINGTDIRISIANADSGTIQGVLCALHCYEDVR